MLNGQRPASCRLRYQGRARKAGLRLPRCLTDARGSTTPGAPLPLDGALGRRSEQEFQGMVERVPNGDSISTRARRSRAHRPLHDGRRRVRRRLLHRAARPFRCRRGFRRRAWREPPGRQRRCEFHRLRRHRGGRDGGLGAKGRDAARPRPGIDRSGARALRAADARNGCDATNDRSVREKLYATMWEKVGIIRDAPGWKLRSRVARDRHGAGCVRARGFEPRFNLRGQTG